jgi:hypothetical protein
VRRSPRDRTVADLQSSVAGVAELRSRRRRRRGPEWSGVGDRVEERRRPSGAGGLPLRAQKGPEAVARGGEEQRAKSAAMGGIVVAVAEGGRLSSSNPVVGSVTEADSSAHLIKKRERERIHWPTSA